MTVCKPSNGSFPYNSQLKFLLGLNFFQIESY